MALDRIQNNYTRQEVFILAYHLSDTFSIPYDTTRLNYYNIRGTPTVWMDGVASYVGGRSISYGEAGIQAMYNTYANMIQTERQRISGVVPFELSLEGDVGPTNPQMRLTVSTTTGYPRVVSAHFVITEDGIPVSASNGQTVMNSVVRAFLGTQAVNLLSSGSVQLTASYTGTVPRHPQGVLRPAVFLEDDATKEILGGVGTFSPRASVPRWRQYR